MPETRLAKLRGTLPEGYQFGDAGKQLGIAIRFIRQFDIEADTRPAAHIHLDAMYDPATDEAVCWCGARVHKS